MMSKRAAIALVVLSMLLGMLLVAWRLSNAQSPKQQMAMQSSSMRRPWVVSKVMIARMQLEPITEKGYIALGVKGEDGNIYSVDDVLAGILEIHERERK